MFTIHLALSCLWPSHYVLLYESGPQVLGRGVLDVGGYPGLILGHVPLATCWTGAGHWRLFINVIMVQVF